MEHKIDINNLALLAQIHLNDGESETLRDGIARLFDMADSLPDNESSLDAPTDAPTDVSTNAPTNAPTDALANIATVMLSDLREDAPIRKIDPEIFFDQSPTSGDGGFVIHRLIE